MRRLLPAVLLAASCRAAPSGGEHLRIVATQVPAGSPAADAGAAFPYPAGSRIVLIEEGTSRVRVLSEGLEAAGAPAVSPDARSVAFAGKRAGSSWAIFESNLRGRPRLAAQAGGDCTDPAYLGGGRLVFSCADGSGGRSLYAAAPGGARRITFGPGAALGPAALRDGRVVYPLRRPDGSTELDTVNADGTWPEAFAGAHGVASVLSRPRETADGGVVFLSGGKLERVELRRPMLERRGLAPPVEAVYAAQPMPDGSLLLAASRGLLLWREGETAARPIFEALRLSLVEAAPLLETPAPKLRPSEVNAALSTGTVLCLDAGLSDGTVGPSRSAPRPAAYRVEAGGELGAAPVEADGSFLMEVPADLPLRVRTLDARGRTLGLSGWFWVRPGEVRTCAGCHEGHERMARNRVPLAVSAPARVFERRRP